MRKSELRQITDLFFRGQCHACISGTHETIQHPAPPVQSRHPLQYQRPPTRQQHIFRSRRQPKRQQTLPAHRLQHPTRHRHQAIHKYDYKRKEQPATKSPEQGTSTEISVMTKAMQSIIWKQATTYVSKMSRFSKERPMGKKGNY